jgi:hypothetical protein
MLVRLLCLLWRVLGGELGEMGGRDGVGLIPIETGLWVNLGMVSYILVLLIHVSRGV